MIALARRSMRSLSDASRTTTANSSPPSRPINSLSVTNRANRSDTWPSRRSPTGWPRRIVDRLESVEVDHHETAARAPFVGLAHRARELFVELKAIREAGQRVEPRHAVDLVGRFAFGGDVAPDPAEAEERPQLIVTRRRGEREPALLVAHLGIWSNKSRNGSRPFSLSASNRSPGEKSPDSQRSARPAPGAAACR